MCYAKPGLRCSTHAREALKNAKQTIEARNRRGLKPTAKQRATYYEALWDWHHTPEGIAEAEREAANETNVHRKHQLEQRAQAFRETRELYLKNYREHQNYLVERRLREQLFRTRPPKVEFEDANAPVSSAQLEEVRVLDEGGKRVVELVYDVRDNIEHFRRRWAGGEPNFEQEVKSYLDYDFDSLFAPKIGLLVAQVRAVAGRSVPVRTRLNHEALHPYAESWRSKSVAELADGMRLGLYADVCSEAGGNDV